MGTFTVMMPAPQPFPVTVPDGKTGGEEMSFVGPDGIERAVLVPEGKSAGDTFVSMIFLSSSIEVKVAVPEGVGVGEEFQFRSPKGMVFKAKVPPGKQAGDEVVVRLPRSSA